MKLTKEEIERETTAMVKIYECYVYLLNNTGSDDILRKKIEDLGREHLLSKLDEIKFSGDLAFQTKRSELEEMIKKLKDEEKSKSGT